jgi:hypothetical protein
MGPAPASGSAGACTSSYYSDNESYDSVGRLSQRAITIPSAGTFTYTWAYNPTTGFLNTLTSPVSTSGYALQLQYAYQSGFPLSVTDVSDSPNVTVWQADTTNAAGQVTQETLGNGIVTNRAYDAVTGWLSSIQSGLSGGAGVQNQSFLYDLALGEKIQAPGRCIDIGRIGDGRSPRVPVVRGHWSGAVRVCHGRRNSGRIAIVIVESDSRASIGTIGGIS